MSDFNLFEAAAAQDTQRLYRILGLCLPSHPQAKYFGNSHRTYSRIPELMMEDPHNELPHLILNGLRQGLGRHWTNSQEWAFDNPWHRGVPDQNSFQVVMGTDHPTGLGHKTGPVTDQVRQDYPDEDETTLKRGTPVVVSDLWFRGPQQKDWSKLNCQPWQGFS